MFNQYLKVLKNKILKKDFRWIMFEIVAKITFNKLELRIDRIIEKKRTQLGTKVSNIYNNSVQQGPFKGMIISDHQFWGSGDKSSKILGLYEKEIQDLLVEIQKNKNYSTFIDIGGADGFFAIGSVVNKLFNNCEVFEISKKGRNSIKINSKKNNVLDQVNINEKATKKSVLELENIGDAVILCDIEGGEYELFDEDFIDKVHPSELIIEIHKNKNKSLPEFENRFNKKYLLKKILQEPRSLKNFNELKNFNDNNRALLVSEGRSYIQEWWYLSPK